MEKPCSERNRHESRTHLCSYSRPPKKSCVSDGAGSEWVMLLI